MQELVDALGIEQRILQLPEIPGEIFLAFCDHHHAYPVPSLYTISLPSGQLPMASEVNGHGGAGQITAAYPFSALPTRHQVRIASNAAVFAMCAIDALGISAMVGLPVVIESADPSTGEPITVNVDQASSTWEPATAVVYVGRTSDECAGPSASVCCGYINFFATGAAAAAWAASHPEITGGILGQDRALQVGIGIFGQLLSS